MTNETKINETAKAKKSLEKELGEFLYIRDSLMQDLVINTDKVIAEARKGNYTTGATFNVSDILDRLQTTKNNIEKIEDEIDSLDAPKSEDEEKTPDTRTTHILMMRAFKTAECHVRDEDRTHYEAMLKAQGVDDIDAMIHNFIELTN